jgi:hypothetical protein
MVQQNSCQNMDTEKDWRTEENAQPGGEDDMTGSKPGGGVRSSS